MMTSLRRLILCLVLLIPLCSLALSCAKRDAGGSSSGAAPAEPGTTDPAPEQPASADRKVIRTAELALRVNSPARAADESRAIAEQFGGYLVSSSASSPREPGSEASNVEVTLKVKADRFDEAVAALRRLGRGTGTETVTTRDVTEESMDLEARLKTQRALEAQFLTILKEAKSVSDALAVHKELGQVRGEIERLEGKRKLLQNQIALSTITLRFEQQEPMIALSGARFGRTLAQAGADALNVGAAIVIGSIRVLGVLLPVTLLVLLPLALGLRKLFRRLTAASS